MCILRWYQNTTKSSNVQLKFEPDESFTLYRSARRWVTFGLLDEEASSKSIKHIITLKAPHSGPEQTVMYLKAYYVTVFTLMWLARVRTVTHWVWCSATLWTNLSHILAANVRIASEENQHLNPLRRKENKIECVITILACCLDPVGWPHGDIELTLSIILVTY